MARLFDIIIYGCLIVLISQYALTFPSENIKYFDNTKYETYVCTSVTGQSGLCTSIENCSESNYIKMTEDICSFHPQKNKIPIVCCIQEPKQSVNTYESTITVDTMGEVSAVQIEGIASFSNNLSESNQSSNENHYINLNKKEINAQATDSPNALFVVDTNSDSNGNSQQNGDNSKEIITNQCKDETNEAQINSSGLEISNSKVSSENFDIHSESNNYTSSILNENKSDSDIIFIDTMKYEFGECTNSVGIAGICRRIEQCSESDYLKTENDICSFHENEKEIPIVCCIKKHDPVDVNPNSHISDRELVQINSNENITSQTHNHNSEEVLHVMATSLTQAINQIKTNSDTKETIISMSVPEQAPQLQITESTLTENTIKTIEECNNIPVRPAQKYCELLYGETLAGSQNDVQGQYLHMAALGWIQTDGSIDWRCGGSLISRNFIITAAHCVASYASEPNLVRIGDINLTDAEPSTPDYNVTKIFVHPNYSTDTLYNDVALVQIIPILEYSPEVKAACLWPYYNISENTLIAMGYGNVSFTSSRANNLLWGVVSSIDNDVCNKLYLSNLPIPNGIVETQICAQDSTKSIDTCQGDSGGPLLFREKLNFIERTYLIGVTSFGKSCLGTEPGVYSRIFPYLKWIENIVWPSGVLIL